MRYPLQFRRFWDQRVIIEERKGTKTYVGLVCGEDPFYLYLRDVTILVDGKKTKTSELALWKGKIGELRLLPEE